MLVQRAQSFADCPDVFGFGSRFGQKFLADAPRVVFSNTGRPDDKSGGR